MSRPCGWQSRSAQRSKASNPMRWPIRNLPKMRPTAASTASRTCSKYFWISPRKRGFNAVIYGNNYDDKADYRPGSRAAQAFGIRAPLMEAELTKPDIRELSRRFGLPTADLPASPCLASRLPYGLDITAERLAQVEQAESFLRELGLIRISRASSRQPCTNRGKAPAVCRRNQRAE